MVVANAAPVSLQGDDEEDDDDDEEEDGRVPRMVILVMVMMMKIRKGRVMVILMMMLMKRGGRRFEDDEDAYVENIDFVQVVVFQGLAISSNFLAENLTFPSVLQFRCFYTSTLCYLEYISKKYPYIFRQTYDPGVEQILDFAFFIISIQIFCVVMDITIQGTEEGGIRLERGTLNYRTGTTYIKIRPPLSAVMIII